MDKQISVWIWVATLAVVLGVLTWSARADGPPPSTYDPEGPISEAYEDQECFWEEGLSYFCFSHYWGTETPYKVESIRVTDGDSPWGFALDATAGPGEMGTLRLYHGDWTMHDIEGSIDGRTYRMRLDGGCNGGGGCFYGVIWIELVEGWVLENGIDLSGQTWEFSEGAGDQIAWGEGWGSAVPFAPWLADGWNDGNPVGSWEPVATFGGKTLETFFGTEIRLEVELSETPTTLYLPEPGSGAMLACGLGTLALYGRRRRS